LTGFRVLFVFGGLLAAGTGRWARTHSDATIRYSAGYGSGFTPGGRRIWGGIVVVVGLLMFVCGVFGVPAEFMR